MWANTLCPFSSSTRNMALGNGSMTVPSTSIASFFGTLQLFPLERVLALVPGTCTNTLREGANGQYRGPPARTSTNGLIRAP